VALLSLLPVVVGFALMGSKMDAGIMASGRKNWGKNPSWIQYRIDFTITIQ
jgi:hypothetical protein